MVSENSLTFLLSIFYIIPLVKSADARHEIGRKCGTLCHIATEI